MAQVRYEYRTERLHRESIYSVGYVASRAGQEGWRVAAVVPDGDSWSVILLERQVTPEPLPAASSSPEPSDPVILGAAIRLAQLVHGTSRVWSGWAGGSSGEQVRFSFDDPSERKEFVRVLDSLCAAVTRSILGGRDVPQSGQ